MDKKQLTLEQILKRRASQKLYYLKNREKKLAYCKQRYAENSEKILAQQAIYRANNKDAINARARQIRREFTLTNPQNNNL
jgi:hypothetical protein